MNAERGDERTRGVESLEIQQEKRTEGFGRFMLIMGKLFYRGMAI
jgi:hypothetical protein